MPTWRWALVVLGCRGQRRRKPNGASNLRIIGKA